MREDYMLLLKIAVTLFLLVVLLLLGSLASKARDLFYLAKGLNLMRIKEKKQSSEKNL